ncbi:hypothetical protein FUAX_20780 [Fulvitalea axinellae]|uniref:Glycoside hydrolase family 42 N-terminal domain-containing protein n=1 Tax=Fulvitalea axinellae TaxID=1182444 RepID=A0AAU9CKZ2_9BACT|nr:hypothetical protein FUAX_20780 [Fulvitalea axinellae]
MRFLSPVFLLSVLSVLIYSCSEKKNRRITIEDGKSVELPLNLEKEELEGTKTLCFEVENIGKDTIYAESTVKGRMWNNATIILNPGEKTKVKLRLLGTPLPDSVDNRQIFKGMKGLPDGWQWHWDRVDPKQIKGLVFSLIPPGNTADLEIGEVELEKGKSEKIKPEDYFPLVDKYGQYKHNNWPGKTFGDVKLASLGNEALRDKEAKKTVRSWNKYGGWADGPKLKATGHFRVEKYQGKWWFVDPSGCLFWSHGIDCVRFGGSVTPVEGREYFFEGLPKEGEPFSEFYEVVSGGRKAYNFSAANLYRKYGEDWKSIYPELVHERLRSWGMNTIGNWSASGIYLSGEKRTPYVVNLRHYWERLGKGKAKFPDIYKPGYREELVKAVRSQKETTSDPFCLGYFIDNELHGWGWLGHTVLASDENSSAKRKLLSTLRSKYINIDSLNVKWKTEYKSWKHVLKEKSLPKSKSYQHDLLSFEKQMVNDYYRTCLEVIRNEAPGKLYLGSRLDFHYYPETSDIRKTVVSIASKYCDVVSFNRYRLNGADFAFHGEIDKPVLIGEFHFGALDRGMLHGGLRSVQNQEQRGKLYAHYVKGAVLNPFIVGTHWFQYQEQVVTGRFDGENYQVGFVDICDKPYLETVKGSRSIGERIYRLRRN